MNRILSRRPLRVNRDFYPNLSKFPVFVRLFATCLSIPHHSILRKPFFEKFELFYKKDTRGPFTPSSGFQAPSSPRTNKGPASPLKRGIRALLSRYNTITVRDRDWLRILSYGVRKQTLRGRYSTQGTDRPYCPPSACQLTSFHTLSCRKGIFRPWK